MSFSSEYFRDFDPKSPLSFFRVLRAALFKPREFFAQVPSWPGMGPPLTYVLITYLVPGVIGIAIALGLGSIQPGPMLLHLALSLAQALIMAWIVFAAARYIMKSSITWGAALRVFAYSGGLWVFSFLSAFAPHPVVGGMFYITLVIVQFYLMMVGLQSAGGLSTPLAVACLIIAFVLMLLGWSLLWA